MPGHVHKVLLTLFCTASFPGVLNAQQEEPPWVVKRTTGEGDSEQEAFDNARHKALAKIVDAFLQENGVRGREAEWTPRLVTADPEYLVGGSETKLVDNRYDDIRKRWQVTVCMELPHKRLVKAVEEATEFLDWFGNPSVHVFFSETVGPTKKTAGTPREDSDVAQGLSGAFNEAGFRVMVSSQTEELRKMHGELDRLDCQDIKTLLGQALRDTTDIIVVGFGRATGPEKHRISRRRTEYYWNVHADCKMFWTDNGELIATAGMGRGVKDSDTNVDAARIQALQKAGRLLAKNLLDSVFRKWSRWAFEGRTVTITVLECSDDEAKAIEDEVRKVFGDEGDAEVVDVRLADNTLKLGVLTKLSSGQLSNAVRDQFSGDFTLEGMEALSHSIRMKLVH